MKIKKEVFADGHQKKEKGQADVAQVSKPAVSPISKSADRVALCGAWEQKSLDLSVGPQIGWARDVVRPAGLETRDWLARSRSLGPSGLAFAALPQTLSRLPKPLK
ncbi:MAG TPA: hypothetical protein VMF08_02760, partial [Candidatus Sulfotelmatobacter sp.]|nr:hypothetical protein [Candidatus Sulfotelmatobacter sp.]